MARANARANALAVAALALCLINIACVFAAPDFSWSESEEQAVALAEAEGEAVEQRAGQEVQGAEEALDEEADADNAALQEQSEQLRAGQEKEQQQEQQETEGEQQRQQRPSKPVDEGSFGRLSNKTIAKPGDQQQDLEQEQGKQQTQGRQGDFGLEGRQQQVPQGGQWPQVTPGWPRQPPQGYAPLRHFGHFKVHTTPRPWMEAVLTCLAEGARLAVPRSEEEVRAVGQLYSPLKSRVNKAQDRELFFIGAHDLLKEGDFVTLIGTKFNAGQYHRWQKGEPNNHGKVEHCVLSNDKGLYWDGNCNKKYAFVCEYKDPCQNSPRVDTLQQPQWPQQQNQGGQQPPQMPPQPAQQTNWQQPQMGQQWQQNQQNQQWNQGQQQRW